MSPSKPEAASESSKSQPDKFRDLARELGCDEDEVAFEDQVRRIAKAPFDKNAPTIPRGEEPDRN